MDTSKKCTALVVYGSHNNDYNNGNANDWLMHLADTDPCIIQGAQRAYKAKRKYCVYATFVALCKVKMPRANG